MYHQITKVNTWYILYFIKVKSSIHKSFLYEQEKTIVSLTQSLTTPYLAREQAIVQNKLVNKRFKAAERKRLERARKEQKQQLQLEEYEVKLNQPYVFV